MCILIHLGEMLYTLEGYILSNQIKNLTVNQRVTSTNRRLHGCGCVATGLVGVVFRLISYFWYLSEMEIRCVVFMERSQ